MDREDAGVWLLLGGLGLGMALMTFVVTFGSTSFYQNSIAPTVTGSMQTLGYVLDGAVVASLAMSVAGIACFSAHPTHATPAVEVRPMSAAQRLEEIRRKKEMRTRKSRKSRPTAASHGST